MIKAEAKYNQNNNTEVPQKNGNIEDNDFLRKLFIGGLPPTATEESLRSFYSQWGDVVDSVVMRDAATKRSRGFGFITYANPQMVDRAQAARPHVIDGKTVDSKRALPRPELGKSESSSEIKKIFVGGLKENHDEQALSDHFSQFGKIVSIKILTDKATGRKRGFAFIEYDDYDSVDKAILHKNHTIKYVLVDVKKSSYKQELAKKGQVQNQNGQQQNGAAQPAVPPGGYLPTGGYNPHAPYGYPPQMPPPAYNGWNGYAQPPAPGYQQPPAAPYGPYGMPPAAPWGPYGSQQPWGGQNGSVGPVPPPAEANTANGWDSSKNFGNYQQSYNGGPQKAGNLQANRVNPYSAPNYGSGGNQAKSSNSQFQDKSSNYNGYTNQKKMIRPY